MSRSRSTLGPVLRQVLRSTVRRQATRRLIGVVPPVAAYRRVATARRLLRMLRRLVTFIVM